MKQQNTTDSKPSVAEVQLFIDDLINDVEREVWRERIQAKVAKEHPKINGFENASLVAMELGKKLKDRGGNAK